MSESFLQDVLSLNTDKFKKVSNDGPLFFEVTFFKKLDTVRDPDTGKLIDLDIISCFEFPQFACLVEANATVDREDDSWKTEILNQFIEYLKIKASAFAKMFVGSNPKWMDDVTVRFSVTTTTK